VLIENFRPGVMEKWGLGPADLWQDNPRLTYARISGYGQDGPWSSKPGFASVCEGVGGLRYVNGKPGEAPMRPNLSLGDSFAGLHTALGIVLACLYQANNPESSGQVIDTALYEATFNMLEGVVPEYDGAGVVREPSGSTTTGIVPTNTYRCSDGKFIIIGANGDSLFRRLCEKMGRDDMAADVRFADNAGRVEHEEEIDAAITEWTRSLDSATALATLDEARVPSGPIFSVEDMMSNPHFIARGLFEEVDVNGKPLKIPAMVPKLSDTPGRTDWPGPEIGEFNDEIYRELLGLSAEELASLREQGVI
jgi:crotonobetainyl-CoA:carnitine CoA-transferase CaiB-like acyl-CoA transferase